ncbi:hypothetical protein JTB14_025758 [Gonioctena quinquepunctata]|nr:hypothetical protein JTB14_025758 [Gonioctena quinquepunctata]
METYATYDQCNFTLIVPKKVINPYKNEFQNLVEQKPFGSFCLKCAACLAVAEQIAITVQKTLTDSKIDEKGQDFANEELRKRINTLCTSGFKNFDLRKYDDNSLVTNKLKCTEHINTKMDGNWTKKLREMCNLYTSYMDLKHLSNDYVDKTGEITTNLCSGTGIFRDCQNIEYEGISRIMDELSCCDDCKCGT